MATNFRIHFEPVPSLFSSFKVGKELNGHMQLISGSWEAIIERWGWQVAKLGQCKRNEGVGGRLDWS